MEAGGKFGPVFFGVVGEGLTFLTHIQSYRHGPTDLFSIGASSSATRFYLTKPVLLQGGSLLYPTPLSHYHLPPFLSSRLFTHEDRRMWKPEKEIYAMEK